MGHRVYTMEIEQAVYVAENVSDLANEEEEEGKERLSSATSCNGSQPWSAY